MLMVGYEAQMCSEAQGNSTTTAMSIFPKVQSRGDCCPRCVSCVVGQLVYAEGEEWTLNKDSCTTCQCVQGVVTCQPLTCVPACQTMTSLPDHCCPVCAQCRHNSRVGFICFAQFYEIVSEYMFAITKFQSSFKLSFMERIHCTLI